MDAAEEQHAAERVAAQGRAHIVGGVRAHGAAHGAGRWCVQFHSSFTFMESSRLIGEPLKPVSWTSFIQADWSGVMMRRRRDPAGEELVVALHIHVAGSVKRVS